MATIPFGNHTFSDLTHYVRTGDFVQALLNDSQDLDEYAFAIGALSHYIADINGHPYINISVGLEYPELGARVRPSVPYDVDHKAHLRVEFGFDVLQVAKGRYAPDDFHNFIGFEVATSLLERAFYDTYRMKLTDIMPREDLAINTYRRSVSQILPEMTKVALLVKGKELQREIPNFNRRQFLYHLSRADYRKSWGTGYKKPGPGAYIMAGIFKLVPKVGPFRAIDFKEPTPRTENLYFKSVDQTVEQYAHALEAERGKTLQMPQIDLDTGKPTKRGEYPLADVTYRGLLDDLANQRFANVNEALRNDIVAFYAGFSVPSAPTPDVKSCVILRLQKTQMELEQLKAVNLQNPIPAAPAPAKPSSPDQDSASTAYGCGE